jgi:hypothetical protein
VLDVGDTRNVRVISSRRCSVAKATEVAVGNAPTAPTVPEFCPPTVPEFCANGSRVLREIVVDVTGSCRKYVRRLPDVRKPSVRDLRRGYVESATTRCEPRFARISRGLRYAGTLILRWVVRWLGERAVEAVPAHAGALNGRAGGKDHSGNISANAAAPLFNRSAPVRNASTKARYFARNSNAVFLSDA